MIPVGGDGMQKAEERMGCPLLAVEPANGDRVRGTSGRFMGKGQIFIVVLSIW